MNPERKGKNQQEIDLTKAITYSRGLPNLGGIPDVSLNIPKKDRLLTVNQQKPATKPVEQQDNFRWGFFSATKRWLDKKLE